MILLPFVTCIASSAHFWGQQQTDIEVRWLQEQPRLPAEKPGSDRAINLSISSTAPRARAATWMGLLSKATDCSAFPGFGGNCVHGSQARFWQRGSMQGEWKLKSGLSSDNCHLGRKSTLGKKRRASRPPTTQGSSRMKRHGESNMWSSQPDWTVGLYCSHIQIFTCKQLDSPS